MASDTDSSEPETTPFRLIALAPFDGQSPPESASDALALEVWLAVSAIWHPSLLAVVAELPRVEDLAAPSPPGAREIRVLPGSVRDQIPSGYQTSAADLGAILLEAGPDRDALVRVIHETIGANLGAPAVENQEQSEAARDFMALGTTCWMLRELTAAMGHADTIDYDSLAREILAGARSWVVGDSSAAVNRLRAGFEILTQARERFYPVDAYLLDLCLIDPESPPGTLADPLESPVPISFIAQANAIESLARRDPERLGLLVKAIADGWADVAGGSYDESTDSLLPVESLIWRFAKGDQVYRGLLDDRGVETFARRRFGLHPLVPQIAKRFGLRYALHLGFDSGVFPVPPEAKRMWEGRDGAALESLMRPPLAADRPSALWRLPARLAATMKDDHVATLPLVHWPRPVAPAYADLRRSAAYSPVLGRFMTLGDYFQNTDRPYESFRRDANYYKSPYLAQAAIAGQAGPISSIARRHEGRARFEALRATDALARALARSLGHPPIAVATPLALIEEQIELDRQATAELDRATESAGQSLAAGVLGRALATDQADHSGWLVVNTLSVPRKLAVVLPDASAGLAAEGPLRAVQLTEEGAVAIVETPPMGFVWIPRRTGSAGLDAARRAKAEDRRLSNEFVSVEIDQATGGLRGLFGPAEKSNRLGQQLVVHGLVDSKGTPVGSRMVRERFELDYAGPALAQATATGALIDPTNNVRLASFRQRCRLWTGRPILEVEIELSDLDGAFVERMAKADPWGLYLGCRWAWPDPDAMLRRLVMGSIELTELDRPESAEGLDISTRKERTALLTAGLPFHRRHNPRMLDTILIAGRESERLFRLGIALELEHPVQAALDLLTPAVVVASDLGPPPSAASGWLVRIDNPAIVITRLEYLESIDDEGPGLAFHLLETTGRAARCRLRLFKNPRRARQVDFQGEIMIELKVDYDAVLVDLVPHELARVVVSLD